MQMDKGKTHEAWQSFKQAQQLDPNSPSLALLELTILCASGELVQAKARAQFWHAHFKRSRNVSPEFLAMLADCARDPMATLFQAALGDAEELVALQQINQLLASASKLTTCYTFERADTMLVMEPTPTIAKLEKQWRKSFSIEKLFLTHTQVTETDVWTRPDSWLSMLEKHPKLWNSFELLEALLKRAQTLLEINLNYAAILNGSTMNEVYSLPWGFMENRPALRLLPHRFFRALDQKSNIDPIACGELLIALNKLLALYLDDKKGGALTHLTKITKRYKVAIDMLFAKSPRQPKFSPQGVKIGKRRGRLYLNTLTSTTINSVDTLRTAL